MKQKKCCTVESEWYRVGQVRYDFDEHVKQPGRACLAMLCLEFTGTGNDGRENEHNSKASEGVQEQHIAIAWTEDAVHEEV